MTASTSSGLTPLLATAARTASAPSVVAASDDRLPPSLPTGVRTAERISVSFIVLMTFGVFSRPAGCASKKRGRLAAAYAVQTPSGDSALRTPYSIRSDESVIPAAAFAGSPQNRPSQVGRGDCI